MVGNLVVENQTSTNMYNVTALLIGIDCPSVDFNTNKLNLMGPKDTNSWSFNVNSNDPNRTSFKFKYMIRFFYTEDSENLDY